MKSVDEAHLQARKSQCDPHTGRLQNHPPVHLNVIYGAAIAAGVAAGCYPGYRKAVQAMVRFSRIQKPARAKKDLYETKYPRYQKAAAALDPVWKDLG
jgi:ribulose kinase